MITANDIIQILILTFVIYTILKAAKGSRFGQALLGVGVLVAVMLALTYVVHFDVLSRIMRVLLAYLAISTVVIFQPEIRRFLSEVGALGFHEKRKHRADGAATREYLAETIAALARVRLGALIAFERGISLRSYEDSGVVLNADFSRELAVSVFTPPLPLHDGGLTIRDGRISAAHCVFPVSGNPALIGSGMRHRAAVGLSEETDALVIVVSEESGCISVAHNGRLIRYANPNEAQAALVRWLSKVQPDNRNVIMAWLEKLAARITKKGGLK